MERPFPRFPLLRIMLGNAFLLSAVYLLTGLGVELLRDRHPAEWVDQLSLVVDSLPARVLDLAGVMPRLKDAYFEGALPGYWLRVIFAGTTVTVIFLLGLMVGGGMYGVRRMLERRVTRSERRI